MLKNVCGDRMFTTSTSLSLELPIYRSRGLSTGAKMQQAFVTRMREMADRGSSGLRRLYFDFQKVGD